MDTLTPDTPTDAQRLAAIERQMAAQAAELERLRASDPAARAQAALNTPPGILSPDALARDRRQVAEITVRRLAMEAHAEAVREQEERDAPKRAKRDAQVAALRADRDAALVRADAAYVEADALAVKLAAIEREPISPPVPLPACLQPHPLSVGFNPRDTARDRAFSASIPRREAATKRRLRR